MHELSNASLEGYAEQPSRGVLKKRYSENIQSNFIEVTLQHGCSPVNLLHIFRTPFPKNTLPVDTGCKLNVHKTFRRCRGRHLNALYTFNLRTVSTGLLPCTVFGFFLTYSNKLFKTVYISRGSRPEMFLAKGVLKICSKFREEHPCRSAISIKLQSSFTEISLWYRGCTALFTELLLSRSTSGCYKTFY